MSRTVMTMFMRPNPFDKTAPVVNCDVGAIPTDQALVGIFGELAVRSYRLRNGGYDLREAQITLNVNAQTGRHHDAVVGSARVFFGGDKALLWMQSEVGAVWRRLAEEVDHLEGRNPTSDGRNTNFTRAESYMLDRPEMAVPVMKELGLAAMMMPVKSALGIFRIVVLLRDRAEEIVFEAEFKDHSSAVFIEVPTARGSRRIALPRKPFRWKQREEIPGLSSPENSLPTLAALVKRAPSPSITSSALRLRRILGEGRAESQAELAQKIGMSPATMSKILSVLELPKPVFEILHRHPERFGSRLCYAFSRYYKLYGDHAQRELKDFARHIVEKPLSSQELKEFEMQTKLT